uniref:Ribonuclease A-domain domain-containing protein n=1 Tax=Fundulus heteroclitus TaxID=8078 RepID=A0A3Q2QB40_FUNHE
MSILPVCLLVGLLLLQGTAPQQNDEVKRLYEQFLNQHVIGALDENDCSKVIEERKIQDKNGFKETNTFIIASKEAVTAICQGRKSGENIESKGQFNVVVCTHVDKGKYKGERLGYHYIAVGCKDYFPVHFGTHQSFVRPDMLCIGCIFYSL